MFFWKILFPNTFHLLAGISSCILYSNFLTQMLGAFSPLSYVPHSSVIYRNWSDRPNTTWRGMQVTKPIITLIFSHLLSTACLLDPNILPRIPFWNVSLHFSLDVRLKSSHPQERKQSYNNVLNFDIQVFFLTPEGETVDFDQNGSKSSQNLSRC
jgi:hypothetical protein